MIRNAPDFAEKVVKTWSGFQKEIGKLSDSVQWLYRGQKKDWPLETSLERALRDWKIRLKLSSKIEKQLIREFRRQYRYPDRDLLNEDTLYCLGLMQHHGAPTRLLDGTYSPYVAAKVAIESGARNGVVWCINGTWCQRETSTIVGKDVLASRHADKTRDDKTFCPLFMGTTQKTFVVPENPVNLNERLVIQQGVFMIPGDVRNKFITNLKAMKDWDSPRNILKLRLRLSRKELSEFVRTLERMNINSAVLFPGLDGFAKSLHEKLLRFEDFANRNVGEPEFYDGVE